MRTHRSRFNSDKTEQYCADREQQFRRALTRMTRPQLIVVADLMNMSMEKIETDFRGPYSHSILIDNIIEEDQLRYRESIDS